MISGEVATTGESLAKRKAYMRSVYSFETEPKRPRSSISITFSNEDLKSSQIPHDNLVVILVVIANFKVNKRSWLAAVVHQIFHSMRLFQKMILPSDCLTLAKSPMYGFIEESIVPKGTFTLSVIIRTHPRQITMMIYFLGLTILQNGPGSHV